MHRVAVLTAALCLPIASRAVAQNATREQALTEAVHVEPEDDPCLGEDIVRARVGKRLARDAELSDVRVTVHATRPPRLSVEREGQVVAERRFEDFPSRCNAQRDAIAVAVALALERAPEATSSDPTSATPDASTISPAGATTSAATTAGAATAGATGDAAKSPSPESAEPPEDDSQSTGPGPDEDPSGEGASLGLGAHAGAMAVIEILPGLAFAGVLGADLKLPIGLRLSLSAIGSLPQQDRALGATIESQLLLGRLLGCADLSADDLALEGCGGVLAGAAFAQGLDYESTRSTELAYAAVLARLALRYPADALLSARLALDGLLPVFRPSYAVREPGPTYDEVTPAPFGAALSFEVMLALP